MRLRRSRLEEFFHKKMTVKKDKEGSTSEEYGAASSVTGESWPASGKVQAEQYGQRLNYIRNIRIQGSYKIQTSHSAMETQPQQILSWQTQSITPTPTQIVPILP